MLNWTLYSTVLNTAVCCTEHCSMVHWTCSVLHWTLYYIVLNTKECSIKHCILLHWTLQQGSTEQSILLYWTLHYSMLQWQFVALNNAVCCTEPYSDVHKHPSLLNWTLLSAAMNITNICCTKHWQINGMLSDNGICQISVYHNITVYRLTPYVICSVLCIMMYRCHHIIAHKFVYMGSLDVHSFLRS